MSAIGFGAKVEINDGGGSSYQAVSALTDIDPPEDEVKSAESKRLDLPQKTLTKVPTVKDPGTFTFSWEMSKTQYDRLQGLKGTAKNFRITLLGENTPTDDVVRVVPGFITMNKPDQVEADKIMTVKTTVAVTGPAS